MNVDCFKPRVVRVMYAALLVAGVGAAAPSLAFDPLRTESMVPATPSGDLLGESTAVCSFGELPEPLRLQDAVERALCLHPKTREAWANVKIQAAAVGQGRAAYLPTLNGNWQGTHNVAHNHVTGLPQFDSDYNSRIQNASVTLSWVLYDFGGRSAALRNATELLAAARANQQVALQTVFATVAKDYYAAQAAQGALAAAREVEQTAQGSADAATARVERGVAAISDQLQAQTAHGEALVSRTKAENDWASAIGTPASDMDLDPATPLVLPDVTDGVQPDHEFGDSVATLIEDAQRRYPGIAAAQAQLEAARAKTDQIRAEGLPKLNLVAQYNFNNQPTTLQLGFPVFPATHREWYLGFQLTIPFFEGFARTYQVRQAQAQTELQVGTLAEARQQLGLDVWNGYQALRSATTNLRNSASLLGLAQQSYAAAEHRYQIGVGSILELLNTQSALANAKKQRIQALTDWRSARLQLASKLGRLDMDSLASAMR